MEHFGQNDGMLSKSVIELLEARQLLSAYFVDAANGSDANTARSPRAAWQTLAAVNNHSFKKRDAVFLTGTFSNQTLVLGPHAAGVSVNTYALIGARRLAKLGVPNAALIVGTSADGIDISASNITLQNISVTADPAAIPSGNYNYGIYMHNSTSVPLTHEVINRVSATGFSYAGLCMQGWNTSTADSAGFSNVLIENSSFFANQVCGIFAAAGDSTGNEFQPGFSATFYVHSNLTIRNCQAYDNPGFNAALMGTPDGVNINQGNFTSGGIFISSVNGAKVQNCTVWNNCFAALGSVGLWAFDSTRVIFQNDESFDNKTMGGDGDGFDFDHGVTDSIMQYDFSHGNVGIGFLIATIGGSSNNTGDTIRYCISDDNGQGILFETTPTAPVLNANIYNNTVLQADTSPATNSTLGIAGDTTGTESINILNNIFISGGADPLVLFIEVPEPNIRIERNDYWLAGAPGTFSVNDFGTIYTSLAGWAAASGGAETLNGINIGLTQDPMLGIETVSDLPKASVALLALSRSSPLRREGLNLSTRPWAGTAPYKLNAPYNLAGPAWGGIGRMNFFGRPVNRRALGAG